MNLLEATTNNQCTLTKIWAPMHFTINEHLCTFTNNEHRCANTKRGAPMLFYQINSSSHGSRHIGAPKTLQRTPMCLHQIKNRYPMHPQQREAPVPVHKYQWGPLVHHYKCGAMRFFFPKEHDAHGSWRIGASKPMKKHQCAITRRSALVCFSVF